MWYQREISLISRQRGFHLITDEIVSQIDVIRKMRVGMLNLFIKHTSASLTLNENVDPTVRGDLENHLRRIIPDSNSYYVHNYEGEDDMPAHIKSSLLGVSLSIPITDGKLNLGTWQGIYLCEHREHGGSRKVVATLTGEMSE